mmetsp:Transcript_47702/g.116872  ORF Transcript_47702/g.116872 Transcript_47702/m.116872 type:complete len:294 (+) Transcript_47702:85-966(+)
MLANGRSVESLFGQDSTASSTDAFVQRIAQRADAVQISDREVGDDGAAAIADAMIEHQHCPRALRLMNTSFGSAGGVALCDALFVVGHRIQFLSLYQNNLGAKGGCAFARALPHMTSLVKVRLDWCDVGDEGIAAVAGALVGNTVVKEIYFYGNKNVTAAVADRVCASLRLNDTLTVFDLTSTELGEGDTGAKIRSALRADPRVVVALQYNTAARLCGIVLREQPSLVHECVTSFMIDDARASRFCNDAGLHAIVTRARRRPAVGDTQEAFMAAVTKHGSANDHDDRSGGDEQ